MKNEALKDSGNILRECNYDSDVLAEKYPEAKEYTQEDIQYKDALRDALIKYSLADDVVLGIGHISCIVSIYKNEDGVWMIYNTDERGGVFNLSLFDNAHDACIEVITRLSTAEQLSDVINYFEKRYNPYHTITSEQIDDQIEVKLSRKFKLK